MNRPPPSWLLWLAVAAPVMTGCAFYFPHSLVASNIHTNDPLISGPRRVEAQICGNRLLGIPFGPDPRMSALMDAFRADVPSAVGFEDIEIDVVRIIYPFFWQDCVEGSASPLFPVIKAAHAPKPPAKAPAPAEPPAAPPTAVPPSADPFQQ